MAERQFAVGVSVAVMKDGKVLLAERLKNGESQGYHAPGGHMEIGETVVQCAVREVAEETGLEIENIRFQFVANLPGMPHEHYVDIGVVADWKGGEPQLLEPERAGEWRWYDKESLPDRLHGTIQDFLRSWKTGEALIDSK